MKTSLLKFILLIFCGLLLTNSLDGVSSCHALLRLKKNPSSHEIIAWEEKIVKLINKERAKFKLSPLRMVKVLSQYAKEHSLNMAHGKVQFGHGGFEKRAAAVQKLGQHNAFGENVAYCYLVEDPLKVSVDSWMKSPGHRDNILGHFDETGVGIAFSSEGHCYITQLFANRR